MRKIALLSAVFMLLALFSCRKDDVFTEVDPPTFPEPGVNVVSSYTGIVLDSEGLGIVDALVIDENGNSEQTDQNGFFSIPQGNYTQGGSLFKVKKDGYIDAYRFVHLQPGQKGYTKVTLIKRELKDSFQSGQGGEIEISDAGAKLKMTANTVVNEDGSAYSGEVNVYAHWYDPSDLILGSSMPGDLRGIDAMDEKVVLETYGMVSVELIGANGERLNLKENTSAELTFPITSSQQGVAPEEIPLWYLDEVTGYWKEEGKASKQGDSYIANVSHFSFWNCDYPRPLVEISGTLMDQNGNLIINKEIKISMENSSSVGTGFTDERGFFMGLVPKDELLFLTTFDGICMASSNVLEIGSFEQDESLGLLELEIFGNDLLSFSGRVLDCNTNQAISNAYVKAFDDAGKILSTAVLQDDGSYQGSIFVCGEPKLYFQAIHLDDFTESQIETWESSTSNLFSVPDLKPCFNLDQYLSSTINGFVQNEQEYLECWYIDDVISLVWSNDQGYRVEYDINFSDLNNPAVESVFINLNEPNMPLMNWPTEVDNFDLSIEEFPTEVGEYIQGELSGEFIFEGVSYDISALFRLELKRNVHSISVHAWLDSDEDGIYDENVEEFVEGVTFQATANDLDVTEGNTSFAGPANLFIPKGKEIDLEVILNGKQLTLSNVDLTVPDNDFEQDGFIRDVVMDKAYTFYCGLLPGPMTCSVSENVNCQDGCFTIEIEGGVPPYSYTLNGVSQPESQLPNIIQCGLDAGSYDIFIQDQSNEECSTLYLYVPSPILDIVLPVEMGCLNDLPIAEEITAIVTGGFPPYAYSWSNGATTSVLQDLIPGMYTITVTDANGCTGTETTIVFDSFLKITGKVWDDNLGSIPDEYESEQGFEGININILDDTNAFVAGGTTDVNGNYEILAFGEVQGTYKVEIFLPLGFELVDKDNASSDEVDSDADPTTMRTDIFSFDKCLELDFDFGLK